MTDDDRILGDLTVLDLTQGIPGAYCTKLLAGLGARVIAVEPPGGSALRATGPFAGDEPHPERSGPFLYLNTAKESVTLNLATASGQAIARELALRANVLIDDFPIGVMAKYGLDRASLAAAHPRLISVSITPFGRTGPYRDWLINEIVAEALGGLMYAVGLPEREPLKIGGNPVLYNAGGAAFSATMAAVWQRDATGEGQEIEISIHEATVLTQIHASIQAAWIGENPGRRSSDVLPAKDGWVAAGLAMGVAPETWPAVCKLMDREDLVDDPRFATGAARREHRDALNEIVAAWVRDQPKVEVYHRLQRLRSIAGYVATTADLYASRQLNERGFFQEIDHPVAGPARYPGPPFRVGGAPWTEGRAPLLGEHNRSVYGSELGYTRDDLVRLREEGAI